MPNDSRAIGAASNRDLATMPLEQAIEAYSPHFAAVLPPNVPLDHFRRMVITALNTSPELAEADRRSFFNACVKCASDGLLPDGREAALVSFNTKVKDRKTGKEYYVKLAQFMPMIAGIRKRMRNSGDVASATAEVIHKNDKFRYRLGTDPVIEHEPAPLDQDAGAPIGAYAIITLKSGERIMDIMRRSEIEAARAQSKAKDSLMWLKFWGEGAKKTVLRRCAKSAPQAATLNALLQRDEEFPELPALTDMSPVPPRPRLVDYVETEGDPAAEAAPRIITIAGADGEERDVPISEAEDELLAVLDDFESRQGRAGIEAFGECNGDALAQLREVGMPGAALEHARRLALTAEPPR